MCSSDLVCSSDLQVYIATEFPELEKLKKSPSGTKSHERRNSANSNRSSVTDEIKANA